MQNKYVGDIGDFGKYGLLRELTGMTDKATASDALRLGVVWYLYTDKENNSDGSGTSYLLDRRNNHKKYRECDKELYDELHKIVIKENDRRVSRVRKSGILPNNTAYYERSLSYHKSEPSDSKQSKRKDWLEGALIATKDAELVFLVPDNSIAIPRDSSHADRSEGALTATEHAELVFLDPDNGIAMPKEDTAANGSEGYQFTEVNPYSKKGPKYVFLEDIRQFYKQGQSLVIYHHLAHRPAMEQINGLARRLQQHLNLPTLPWALRYRRGSPRVYFIAAQESHRIDLERRLQQFTKKSCWFKRQPGFPHPHFELVMAR